MDYESKPFHYGADDVRGMAEPIGGGTSAVTLRLRGQDTAWNPASTKHLLYAPATVHYFFYADGGAAATVEPLAD